MQYRKSNPIVLIHIPTKDFCLEVFFDASKYAWGAFLAERITTTQIKFCRFASGKFTDAATRYPSAHKEILAAKKAISSFPFFLLAIPLQLTQIYYIFKVIWMAKLQKNRSWKTSTMGTMV